jgi:cell division septum initiation protein DivIVA
VVIIIDILELVDRLEKLVNTGWRVPLSAKTAIDENAFFELIDQMRVSVPQEIKRANELMQEREKVLAAASEEADQIIEGAHEQATRLVDEHEIMAAARAEAEGIKSQARRESAEILKGADEYATGVLGDLESNLAALLQTTANGLAKLKKEHGPPVPPKTDGGMR